MIDLMKFDQRWIIIMCFNFLISVNSFCKEYLYKKKLVGISLKICLWEGYKMEMDL